MALSGFHTYRTRHAWNFKKVLEAQSPNKNWELRHAKVLNLTLYNYHTMLNTRLLGKDRVLLTPILYGCPTCDFDHTLEKGNIFHDLIVVTWCGSRIIP